MNRNELIQKMSYRAALFIKKNSATILTCVGAAGVVATTALAIASTPKAIKQLDEAEREKGEELTKVEIVRTAGPVYIPTIIVGAATLTCIFGANVLSKQKQAVLTSAYALLDSSYKEYRNKLKELYGEEADQNIRDAIMVEKAQKMYISSECLCSNCDLSVEDGSGELKLFYDEWSKRYFEATIEQVITAEYHLNRNFVLRGSALLNELYEFLGLELTPTGSTLGWAVEDELYWVDFNHRKVALEDGMECYIIEAPFEPSSDLLDYYYY